ncbi:MAG: hypothetical protein GF400_07050 [Candidatus Eisenbacteria bacterium]|nr:hypothetical protein [Candidatus Eisenbacteria bacterium]
MRVAIAVALVAVASLALAAETITSPAGVGNAPQETEWQPAKEVVVKWSQLPDLEGNAVSSEWCDDIALITDMADDFYCEDGNPIVALEWWATEYNCGTYGPPIPIDYFIVRFYADAGGSPGGLLYEEQVDTWTEEYTAGGDMYSEFHYSADLPVAFLQQAANTYWLQIQAHHTRTDYCQWGWHQCLADQQWGAEAHLKSDYFSVPDWTALSILIGYHFEASFVIYADVTSPVAEGSWTTIKAMYR